MRRLLGQINDGEMDADYETRLRIEGGLIALEAAIDLFDNENEDADEEVGEDVPLTEHEHDAFEEIAERMRGDQN